VNQIAAVDTDHSDRPRKEVKIEKMEAVLNDYVIGAVEKK
jgi:hypothetical protein